MQLLGFVLAASPSGWSGDEPQAWALAGASPSAAAEGLAFPPAAGRQFLAWTNFSGFAFETRPDGSAVLTSPEVVALEPWNQLVLSWNTRQPADACLTSEARPMFTDRAGRFYVLGVWTTGTSDLDRGSVNGQGDLEAEVLTDTLVLGKPAAGFQLRLTLKPGRNSGGIRLRFLGVSLLDEQQSELSHESDRRTWGRALDVPARSQLDYAGGDNWCSPTTVSMVLAYWARQLNRPELDHAVPAVARGVFDPNWPGTGNWSFNVAYAGSLGGMRAYVHRLAGLPDLERWIEAGVPVPVSVTYSVLKGQPNQRDGHLVVCTGFTETGDVMVNDPGSRVTPRRTIPRARFIDAWAQSHFTAYLIYPESLSPPSEKRGCSGR